MEVTAITTALTHFTMYYSDRVKENGMMRFVLRMRRHKPSRKFWSKTYIVVLYLDGMPKLI